MNKSNKQKCLEMWEWLAENPGKRKQDYREHLTKLGREKEYSNCWACREAKERGGKGDLRKCYYCPITWHSKQKDHSNRRNVIVACSEDSSPYNIWAYSDEVYHGESTGIFSSEQQQDAALEVINLIKTTWR